MGRFGLLRENWVGEMAREVSIVEWEMSGGGQWECISGREGENREREPTVGLKIHVHVSPQKRQTANNASISPVPDCPTLPTGG